MNSELQKTENRAPQQQRAVDGEARDQPFVVPPVDVFEDESGITLLADLPGVSRDRLGVRVDGEVLLLEATASTEQPQKMDLVYGEAELDSSRIEAALKDGVLKLSIPKLEEAKPRRIEVRVG
jgi:HSP20 family protein